MAELEIIAHLPKYEEPSKGIATFILDVETSGFQSIPSWVPQNQIIQVAVLHVESREVFNAYCLMNPGNYLPPASTNTHRIGSAYLESVGRPMKESMQGLKNFINSKANDQTPLIVAHNASFDMMMVIKTFEECFEEYAGRRLENHSWIWFDTLSAFRNLYPEIDEEMWPAQRPFSLRSLMLRFYPSVNMGAAHNASVDVCATGLLFVERLLPRLKTKAEDSEFVVSYSQFKSTDKVKRLRPLTDISGIGITKNENLKTIYNRFLETLEIGYNDLKCPSGNICAMNFIAMGYILYKRHLEQNKLKKKIACPWQGTLFEIEYLLRTELKIYSDNIIASFLAAMIEDCEYNLAKHTMSSEGEKNIFPLCSGLAVAYLPLVVTDEEARRLALHLKLRSITEIMVSLSYTPSVELSMWTRRFNSIMLQERSLAEIQGAILAAHQYGG